MVLAACGSVQHDSKQRLITRAGYSGSPSPVDLGQFTHVYTELCISPWLECKSWFIVVHHAKVYYAHSTSHTNCGVMAGSHQRASGGKG